jgi:predicted DNA-binding transcriptional regulator YafY
VVAKLERLLNLTAALLETTRPLSADELRLRVPGYPEAKTSFRRAFERDKDDLREMGIPLQLDLIERDGHQVDGYRIPKDEYYLPDPDLTADELAALHLAASTVLVGGQRGSEALWKLGGAVGQDADAPMASLPVDPHLATLFEAIRRRRQARFTYRGQPRVVDPARLGYERGRWYLTGHDHSRGGTRMFRLDRIETDVELDAPESAELLVEDRRSTARPWELGGGEPTIVELRVDADHLPFARRALGPSTGPAGADGSARFTVPVRNADAFRSFVLGLLDHAEVVAPASVRDELISWLDSMAVDR